MNYELGFSFLDIGVARILSGVHFFLKKVDIFSRRPQKTVQNY